MIAIEDDGFSQTSQDFPSKQMSFWTSLLKRSSRAQTNTAVTYRLLSLDNQWTNRGMSKNHSGGSVIATYVGSSREIERHIDLLEESTELCFLDCDMRDAQKLSFPFQRMLSPRPSHCSSDSTVECSLP